MSDDNEKTKQQSLKDRMERAASRVISERLGVPMDADGKVDFSKLPKTAVEDNAKELTYGILNSLAQELGSINKETAEKNRQEQRERQEEEAAGDDGVVPPAEDGVDTPEGVEHDDDDDDTSRPDWQVNFEAWGDKLTKDLEGKLKEWFGLPPDTDLDNLDISRVKTDELTNKLKGGVKTITETMGKLVESMRSQIPGALESGLAAPKVVSTGEDDSDAVVPSGEDVQSSSEAPELVTDDALETPESAGDTPIPSVEDGEPADEENVVSLQEWRERLRARTKTEGFVFGQSLQETFSRIIEEHLAPAASKDGNINLSLDEGFFKEHGAALLASALQDIAKNLMPKSLELTLPMTDEEKAVKAKESGAGPEESSTAQGDDGDEGAGETKGDPQDIKVSVKLDFGGLFSGLFNKISSAVSKGAVADRTPAEVDLVEVSGTDDPTDDDDDDE